MSATATSGQREHDKHSAALKSSAMLSEQNEGLCPPAPLTETGAEDGPPLLGRASRSHILSLRSSETATGATWENPQLALRIRRPDLEAESREPACTQEPGPSRPGAGSCYRGWCRATEQRQKEAPPIHEDEYRARDTQWSPDPGVHSVGFVAGKSGKRGQFRTS